ncbi:unnamed protein product [Gongylonema pulchrum]|uniref:Protein kinase domain-containing protein n=1 Tax=Gongylonema pulchrum TaxID=637853 RepID=A0A183EPM0_9BILA|nr:unnamed protein product [Gongylonema pulchrum]
MLQRLQKAFGGGASVEEVKALESPTTNPLCTEVQGSSSSLQSSSGKRAAEQVRDVADLVNGEQIDQWKISSFIGEGAYGCVYKVIH